MMRIMRKKTNQSPCMGCELRVLKCHANCNKYIEFRKHMDEVNERRFAYNEYTSHFYNIGK